MHHVIGPVGDPDYGQPCCVADDKLDVVGVGSATPVVDHNHGLGEFAGANLQMSVGRLPGSGAGHDDLDRRLCVGAAADGDDCRVLEGRKRLGGNAI